MLETDWCNCWLWCVDPWMYLW